MEKIPDKIKKDMACDRIGRKLVKYLETNRDAGVIDFRLRIDSPTHFYIHPQNKDGETLDISWDWTKGTYGNEVFGYINKGNETEDSQFSTQGLLDALEKIQQMKLEEGETDYKYAFNRCWHIATEAINKHKQ